MGFGARPVLFSARRMRGNATNRTQPSKRPVKNALASMGQMIGMTCMCGTSEVSFNVADSSVGSAIHGHLILITGMRGNQFRLRMACYERFLEP